MKCLGNYAEDHTIDFEFSTHKADGTPATLSGTPAVVIRKGNTAAPYGESPAACTLSVDFNSVTGLNHVRIDTSVDAWFAVGADYSVALSAGTVDGTSVVGTVLATFSIENRWEPDAATEAEVAAIVAGITQAQRVRVCTPPMMERPDTGSTTYRIWIYAYDELHQAEDLDAVPVVTAQNNTAANRSANLGTVTQLGEGSVGIYYVDYTVASTHAIEGLFFNVGATEGGNTTNYPASSIVVDTTAVDFTADDRTILEGLGDRLIGTIAAGMHQPQTGDVYAVLPANFGDMAITATTGEVASNVVEWKGTVPADLTDTDKVQVSVQHVKAGLLQTAADVVAAMNLPANFEHLAIEDVNGRIDIGSILGTALTETSTGYLAAAFKKFLDVAIPASTMNDLATAQGVLKAATGVTGTITVVASTGVPATDGATLKAAVEALTAGQGVIVGPGTFALGNAKISQPANTVVVGSGRGVTIITSSLSTDTQYVPGTGSRTSGFTLKCTATVAYGMGVRTASGDANFTDALIEDVDIESTWDGIYINSTGIVSATVRNVRLKTTYDGFTVITCASGSWFDVYDLAVAIDTDVQTVAQGIIITSMAVRARFYNPKIHVRNTKAASTGYGIVVSDLTGDAGTGGCVTVLGGSSSGVGVSGSYDVALVNIYGNAVLHLIGTQYDRTKTSGSFTEHATDKRSDLVDAPNATAVTAIQNGLATPTNITAGTITTVTNLTNLPAGCATSANQDTMLGRLGAWTGTGVNTILGAFKSLLSKAASTPSDIGGTFSAATDSTEAIKDTIGTPAGADIAADIAAIESGTGFGANTVMITVNDGTNPLESAKVRLTKGAETYTSTTNTSGQSTFNVDDGTWTVAITLANYTYAGTTLVVDGDETPPPYSMSVITVPASDPDLVTIYATVRDENGDPEAGVEVELQMQTAYSGSDGNIWTGQTLTDTSDVNGLVSFANRLPGSKYRIRRGDMPDWEVFTLPATATDPTAIPDLVGEG